MNFSLNISQFTQSSNSNQIGWAQKNVNQLSLSKAAATDMLCDAKFCQESDFIIRTFGNYLYAMDCSICNLHVYSLKEKQWNYSKLKDLGV